MATGVLTDCAERAWLDLVLRGDAFVQPDVYLGLFTANPGEAGALANEVSGNGYDRLACANWDAPSGRLTRNTDTVMFPTAAGGDWGSITHMAILDSGTPGAGNALVVIPLTAAKYVAEGETPQFAATQIVVSVPSANGISNYLADALLNHLLRKGAGSTAYSAPATKKLALCFSSPGDAGTLDPPVGNAYAHTTHNAWYAAATDGSNVTTIKNDGACTFPTCTPGAWGTLPYGAVTDGTNALFYGALTTPIAVGAGDTPQVGDSQFVIQLN